MDRFIAAVFFIFCDNSLDLKSSMDRFIDYRDSDSRRCSSNLKSSMDRFIAFVTVDCVILNANLKSSMDRFIDLLYLKADSPLWI